MPQLELTIPARFDGVAVIWQLPQLSIAALTIQEAAFGEHPAFPSLESLVRERGLAYRIVQSICLQDRTPYIYWGVQTPPQQITSFVETVHEWLMLTLANAERIEAWFAEMWAACHPGRHRSVAQLIRDVDRTAAYLGSDEQVASASLRDYIRQMRELPCGTVRFVGSEGL